MEHVEYNTDVGGNVINVYDMEDSNFCLWS